MTAVDTYVSWGRPGVAGARAALRPRWRDEVTPGTAGAPVLAFGNGRSYGDSCLNRDGTLIDMRGLDRFVSFDAETGILRCDAGVLLADILDQVVPHGWFLPVTPGTRQVTVGGAIANDVHGKNHHHAGSFGHHVRAFELLRSDGTRRVCTPRENADWFAATVGGLGLTGIIVWAEIALKPVPGPAVDTETLRFSTLEQFLELSRASHNTHEYTVAWIDSLASNGRELRGIFFRGNHARAEGPLRPPRATPAVPFTPPVCLLPPPLVRAFNAATYLRPRRTREQIHYDTFFYPLDAVPGWNRLFGRRGFYQYQCVVPTDGGVGAVRELLDRVSDGREGSFLSVLKVFGDRPAPGWLSFARPGITMAFDFPDRGERTRKLLDALDEVTAAAGGAVYPAKDARMSAHAFRNGFPDWHRLERYRDPAFMSDLWRRVTGEIHA